MKLGVAGRSLVLFVVIGCAGCPPPAPPPDAPPPFDADAAPYDAPPYDAASWDASPAAKKACINLRLLGCPADESGPRCEETVDRILAAGPGFLGYDPKCVADAQTVEAVRRCPTILCGLQK